MKKQKSIISHHAYTTVQEKSGIAFENTNNLANNDSSSLGSRASSPHKNDHNRNNELSAEQLIEIENLMLGGTDDKKSLAANRNLNQMFDVLNTRIGRLNSTVSQRMQLCANDLDPSNNNESKMAGKIVDVLDEQLMLSKLSIKDKYIQREDNNHTHNLVTTSDSTSLLIDPSKLIFKSKQSTETSRRLDLTLGNIFGNELSNNMDTKNTMKASIQNRSRNQVSQSVSQPVSKSVSQ